MKINFNRILFFSAVAILQACSQDRMPQMRVYYEQQVNTRIKNLLEIDSSYRGRYQAIREEFSRIILVSKDNGNATAAVRLSARLLDRLCAEYDFDRSDFPDITTEMDLTETEHQLRENELAFFNRVMLLRQELSEEGLFTAH